MSIRHMSEIWADPYFDEKGKAKLLVALAIADRARAEDGVAWPGLEWIARNARTSVREAQRSIREMEDDGKLAIEIGKGPNGTNLYRLITQQPTAQPQSKVVTPRQGDTTSGRPKAPVKAPVKAAAHVTQSIRNHQESSKSTTTLPEPPDGARSDHARFIELWTLEYPKHHHGEAYAFQNGKDGMAVRQLLAISHKTPDDLTRMAVAAWQKPDGFNCKAAASICGFNSRFNEIRSELNATKGAFRGTPIPDSEQPDVLTFR